MAYADHLRDEYPFLSLLIGDMPGSMTVERRVLAMDYLSQVYPSVWLLWSAIRPLSAYWQALGERGFWSLAQTRKRAPVWCYARGIEGSILSGSAHFETLVFLWGAQPLGASECVSKLVGQKYPRRREDNWKV